MPTLYPVPDEATIETLLASLVPSPTQVSRADRPDPERDATGVFAEYIRDDDELAVVCYADPDVVNYVGGTMIGIDAETLTGATSNAMVHGESLEGFQEVVNIFASCLNTEYTPHLRLGTVHNLPGPLNDPLKELWRGPRARVVYRLAVEEHGAGSLILYLS